MLHVEVQEQTRGELPNVWRWNVWNNAGGRAEHLHGGTSDSFEEAIAAAATEARRYV